MTNIIGCFFFLLFGFLIVAVALFTQLAKFLFGFRRRSEQAFRPPREPDHETETPRAASAQDAKFFKQDEGEYIDFEDLPDNSPQPH